MSVDEFINQILNGTHLYKDIYKYKDQLEYIITTLKSKPENGNCLNVLGCIYSNDPNIRIQMNYSKAFEYFNRARKLGSSRAYSNLAGWYATGLNSIFTVFEIKKDIDKAYKYYQKALDLGFSDCLADFGNFCLNEDKFDKAHELFNTLTSTDEEKPILLIAKVYEKRGHIQLAIEQLYKLDLYEKIYELVLKIFEERDKILELEKLRDRQFTPAILELGKLYYAKGGYNKFKAIELYQEAANLGNPHAWVELGIHYWGKNSVDHDKVFECFSRSAELGNIAAKCNVSVCYLRGIGVEKNVLKSYEIAREMHDSNFDTGTLLLGNILTTPGFEHLGGVHKAIELITKCLNGSVRVRAHLDLGIIYYVNAEVRDIDRAITLLKQVPTCLESHLVQGEIYHYQRKFQLALESFQEALKHPSENYRRTVDVIYHLMGKTYRALGQAVEAVEHFRKGIEMENVDCIRSLAGCYRRGTHFQINIDKSIRLYLHAIRLGHDKARTKLNQFSPLALSDVLCSISQKRQIYKDKCQNLMYFPGRDGYFEVKRDLV